MMDGVMMNGVMTGVRLDDMNIGNRPMTIPQALCHWEVLIFVQ